MKALLTVAVLALFLSLGYGQDMRFKTSSTTLQDYNYITKGLIRHFTEGEEMKSGFSLAATGVDNQITWTDGAWRMATLYYLRNDSYKKNVAIVVKCTDNGNTLRFMCIPSRSSGSQLWDLCFKDFRDAGQEWNLVFMWAFAKMASDNLFKNN